MSNYYNMALKEAAKSEHPAYRMAAIVVKGGSVVSKAFNIKRETIGTVPNRGRHAEARALKPHMSYIGATIYVARHDSGVSRPCNDCWSKIKDARISKVIYMDVNGCTVIEKVF